MSQLLPLKKADFTVQIPIDIPREELALKPSPEAVWIVSYQTTLLDLSTVLL